MRIVAVLFWIFLVAGVLYGWIENIIILIHSSLNPLTALEIVRFVGIFVAPVGAILGYF